MQLWAPHLGREQVAFYGWKKATAEEKAELERKRRDAMYDVKEQRLRQKLLNIAAAKFAMFVHKGILSVVVAEAPWSVAEWAVALRFDNPRATVLVLVLG